jgi:mono/diheme cytochrome c family protein
VKGGPLAVAAAVWASGFIACSRLPSPPESPQSLQGLIRDGTTGVYYDSAMREPFADIPRPFREFFAHCSGCHSNLAADTEEKRRAKARMNLNDWAAIKSFGPSRLLAAANAGTMPPAADAKVPDTLVEKVIVFLGSWSYGGEALGGTAFTQARALVGRFCADCHTAGGRNADRPRAHALLPLDTYAQWKEYQDLIAGRLAPGHPGGNPMPPPKHPIQPSAAERNLLLDWIARNSPDTQDGLGEGRPDTTRPDGIVSEGAMGDVLYAPARRIVNFYCADCHTAGGGNKDQVDAWKNADVKLDTHAGWIKAVNTLLVRLDPPLAAAQRPFPFDPMPKPSFARQPSQAERDTLLAWLRSGSPNTITGN